MLIRPWLFSMNASLSGFQSKEVEGILPTICSESIVLNSINLLAEVRNAFSSTGHMSSIW